MAEGNAEMRALFKLLENNNKIDIKQINILSKQLTDLVPTKTKDCTQFSDNTW